eukprot:TRINITY_DN694_c0_g2_i2.p1 TRINITY_DN694_c0_g2~~TRINITY_DN694_c0_g2_i2.p1  ORF type:complete len:240 (+),score=70.70 TRINITY_DN694_c0_g2_i2:45-722(+)
MRVHALLATALVAVVVLAQMTQAFYYVLPEGQKKCFIEEVPKDTLVMTRYHAEILDRQAAAQTRNQQKPGEQWGVLFEVISVQTDEVLYTRELTQRGRVPFQAPVGGEYKICLKTSKSRWFGGAHDIRYRVSIEKDTDAVDYKQLAKKEQLSNLDVKVRLMNDKIKSVRKQQQYLKDREQSLRDTTESTNARVIWWTFAEFAVVLFCGLWQVKHLKAFFKSKKLV